MPWRKYGTLCIGIKSWAKREYMIAISVIDSALWDLIGKAGEEPIIKLLVSPIQEKVPAYASMLGFSLEPEKEASRRCLEIVEEGFTFMNDSFEIILKVACTGFGRTLV